MDSMVLDCGVAVLYNAISKRTRQPLGLKCVPSVPLRESLAPVLRRVPRLERSDSYRRKYGDTYMCSRLGRWVAISCDPELAKILLSKSSVFPKMAVNWRPWLGNKLSGLSSLFDSNGEAWKRHKEVCMPAFQFDRLQEMVPLFGHSAYTLATALERQAIESTADGVEVDMADAMQRITLDILGKVAFGLDFGGLKDLETETPETALYNSIMSRIMNPFHLLLAIATGEHFQLPPTRNLINDINRFDAIIYDLISERRRVFDEKRQDGNTESNTTLLDLMIQASASEEKKLTNEELRNNCVLFMIAGHDTTASSLLVALHALSMYPHYQSRARNQCEDVMGDRWSSGAICSFEDQKRFTYLDAIIKEGLRLFPPAQVSSIRCSTEDLSFKDMHFPEGTNFCIDIVGLHHHEGIWDEPHRFKPERFENGSRLPHPFAWLPFGGGVRACVGRVFSMIEQRVILCTLLQHFEVLPLSLDTFEQLKTTHTPLLSIKNLRMTLKARS